MGLLLLFICISASFVNKEERLPSLMFGVLDCLFYALGADIDGAAGYIMAGVFDAIITAVMYSIFRFTLDRLSIILMLASSLSIMINIYGLAAYENFSDPYVYNSLFAIYYLSIIVLFFTRVKPNARIRDRNISVSILDSTNDKFIPIAESK